MDYITRAENRLAAVEALYARKSWADVVRESQEIVELALKALLRSFKIEVPRIHDVSSILTKEISRLPDSVHQLLPEFKRISKRLRRDRELAFYGSEDLTPSEFYTEEDAKEAYKEARWVVEMLKDIVIG